MTSTLPTRWQDCAVKPPRTSEPSWLGEGATRRAALATLDHARSHRWSDFRVPLTFLGERGQWQGDRSLDRSAVISTRSAGLGASMEDLAPRVTTSAATIAPPGMPPVPREPHEPSAPRRVVRRERLPRRDWRRTDKVVRVEAGVPITVYIRRDLTPTRVRLDVLQSPVAGRLEPR